MAHPQDHLTWRMEWRGSIGVFDSGFGGLNTLRHLMQTLPEYDYVYLADSARAPYGARSREEIYAFSMQALEFLFARGSELVIFACNTASSDALHLIQTEYLPARHPGKKVLGVLIPLSEAAVTQTQNKKIGILATEGTVRSRAFTREITKLDPEAQVFQRAAPLLVPIIEAGTHRSIEAHEALCEYLQPLVERGADTIILGCTHYDVFRNDVAAIARGASVITEGPIVAEKLSRYLKRHPEVDEKLRRSWRRDFYSTAANERFNELGSTFLGSPLLAQSAAL